MAPPDLKSPDSHWPIFTRLWGIALVAHVVGNWGQPDVPELVGWVNLAVGLAGVFLAVVPTRPALLAASALVVVSVLAEIPVTGNHWLVAGLVSLVILVAGGRPEQFSSPARLVLLVFYGFAAFAKLNSGFFDPSSSCAVFYANQWLDGFGIGPLAGESAGAVAAIWGSIVIELSIPLLLVWHRTRALGVIVGSLFHSVLSFDLNQHFYDFTAALLPLFFLFSPPAMARKVHQSWAAIPSGARRIVVAGFLVVCGAMVVGAVVPLWPAMTVLVTVVPFFLWVPFSIWWLIVLVRAYAPGQRLTWNLRPLAALVVAATFVNGLTPYTEIKTAYSFNMYANLLTAGGESNHFLLQRTVQLREGYVDPVEILDSSDPGLLAYRDSGYLIAYPQFRQYLVVRPEVSIDYRRGEVFYSVPRVGDRSSLAAPVPWWWRYFPLRAIDIQRPPRCQDVFLGAL